MVFGWLKRKREVAPKPREQIIRDFDDSLPSSNGSVKPILELPHDKEIIHETLLEAIRLTPESNERSALRNLFVRLGEYQTLTGEHLTHVVRYNDATSEESISNAENEQDIVDTIRLTKNVIETLNEKVTKEKTARIVELIENGFITED